MIDSFYPGDVVRSVHSETMSISLFRKLPRVRIPEIDCKVFWWAADVHQCLVGSRFRVGLPSILARFVKNLEYKCIEHVLGPVDVKVAWCAPQVPFGTTYIKW